MTPLQSPRGFTLIELLVVIGIIGIITTIVLGSISSARVRARDAARITQLKGLESTLAIYYSDNGAYPSTFAGTSPAGGNRNTNTEVWYQCFGGRGLNYIPLIGAQYNITLPSDPKLDCTGVTYSWTYASNGVDFKLVTHPETSNPTYLKFVDTATDGGPNDSILDGNPPRHIHYGIWSAGAANWNL